MAWSTRVALSLAAIILGTSLLAGCLDRGGLQSDEPEEITDPLYEERVHETVLENGGFPLFDGVPLSVRVLGAYGPGLSSGDEPYTGAWRFQVDRPEHLTQAQLHLEFTSQSDPVFHDARLVTGPDYDMDALWSDDDGQSPLTVTLTNESWDRGALLGAVYPGSGEEETSVHVDLDIKLTVTFVEHVPVAHRS